MKVGHLTYIKQLEYSTENTDFASEFSQYNSIVLKRQ